MPRKCDPEYVRELKGKKPRIPKDEQLSFPTAVTITPPSYLSRNAEHHWERMALILATAGLLQEVGRDKLGRYCQACADYEEIQEERKKLGRKKLIVTVYNHTQFSHWLRSMEMCSKEMKDFEQEYGLTPASAARVRRPGSTPGKQSPQEKFADYLDEAKA